MRVPKEASGEQLGAAIADEWLKQVHKRAEAESLIKGLRCEEREDED